MKKVHFEMSLSVCSGKGERFSSAWGGASEDYLKVCFVGLVVGGNYIWCLVIVVIFVGSAGAKRWGGGGGRDSLKSSFGVAMQATRTDSFYGEGGFSLCNTAVLKFYCKSYWVLQIIL